MAEDHGRECLRYFSEILRVCKSGAQFERVFHLIVYRIAKTYACQAVAIVLIDPDTEYLTVANSYGVSLTFCKELRKRLATGAVGELIWTGKPILIEDSNADQERAKDLKLEEEFGSAVAIQISVDQKSLGYLQVESKEKYAFSSADIPLLQAFADIAGLAYVKSRLYEENLRLDPLDPETHLEKYAPFLEGLRSVLYHDRMSGEPFSLLLLDCDNFKSILNTYGREAANELLMQLADLVRKGQHVIIHSAARYGFDELIVLLDHCTQENAIEFASELRKKVEESEFTKHKLSSTISIGLSSYPQNGTTTDELLVTVKNALFEAQRAGKNKIYCFQKEWYTKNCSVVE